MQSLHPPDTPPSPRRSPHSTSAPSCHHHRSPKPIHPARTRRSSQRLPNPPPPSSPPAPRPRAFSVRPPPPPAPPGLPPALHSPWPPPASPPPTHRSPVAMASPRLSP